MPRTRAALFAVPIVAAITPAHGASPADAPPALTFTGDATIVSDYRFRGVSRSEGDPAPQDSVRVDTLPGFYASAWGSRVAAYAGADAEIDLYGGWTRSFGGWRPDAGVYGYLFPGGHGADFYEVYGALSHDLGPASATLGVNYAPPQRQGQDNVYVSASLEVGVPRTPVTLRGGIGYENGFLGTRKLDWRLGGSVEVARRVTLGLRYVDTNARGGHAHGGAVASIGVRF